MSGPPKGTFIPVSPVRLQAVPSTDSDEMHSVNSANQELSAASAGRILCVGMCVLDIIHVCQRFPEEDSDRRCEAGYWQRGGNASNNATVLTELGASVEFLGMMTEHQAFQFLHTDCRERGISTTHCPHTDMEPPFSSILLSRETGTRTIIHAAGKFPPLQHEHFTAIDLNSRPGYRWIHFEARNANETQGMLRDIQKRNERTRHEAKIRTSLDLEQLCADNWELAELVDYVFLGKDYALFCGWDNARSAVFGLRERVEKLRHQQQQNCSPPSLVSAKANIICPWGSCGVVCLDSEDRFASIPAKRVTVVDSLGAGDTFCAATIFALSHLDMSLRDAVNYGNTVAGFKVTKRGYDDIGAQFRAKSA